jgi:hypothetical protein
MENIGIGPEPQLLRVFIGRSSRAPRRQTSYFAGFFARESREFRRSRFCERAKEKRGDLSIAALSEIRRA